MIQIPLTVQTTINQPIEKIWDYWNNPEHIKNWAFASDDWCVRHATNDLRVGGTFLTRMEAKDGSEGFDFEGVYTEIDEYVSIAYTFGGRDVRVEFIKEDDGYKVKETFDPEDINPIEVQQQGWQSILENFKTYVNKN